MLNKICCLIIILQLVALPVYAQDYNALRKLARGAVNSTLGITEVIRQMIKVNEKEGDIAGLFWGPLKGVVCALGRTVVGVYEVATFILPTYKPLVMPEFIFSKEKAE